MKGKLFFVTEYTPERRADRLKWREFWRKKAASKPLLVGRDQSNEADQSTEAKTCV